MNPEIEEKLLTLQRYQEKTARGEPFDPVSYSPPPHGTRTWSGRQSTAVTYDSGADSDEFDDEDSDEPPPRSSRKRGAADEDDDDEWVLDSPRKYIKKADREKMERKRDSSYSSEVKKPPVIEEKPNRVIVKTSETGQIRKNIIFCNRAEEIFIPTPNDSIKNADKALLASKLKMRVTQKSAVNNEQVKCHKLQVIFDQKNFFLNAEVIPMHLLDSTAKTQRKFAQNNFEEARAA